MKLKMINNLHMDQEVLDAPIRRRGIKIVSFAIESMQFDEASKAKIDQYEIGSDSLTQQGIMTSSYAKAMENAAGNASPSGASNVICSNCGLPVNGKFCSNCGSLIPQKKLCPACKKEASGKFCSSCGANLEAPAKKFCPDCGTEVPQKFCPNCGKSIE